MTFSKDYIDPSGTSYSVKSIAESLTDNQLVDLLTDHSEGIWIYVEKTNGGQHAIVITDYEKPGDIITFYADDPQNNYDQKLKSGRVPLNDTFLYSEQKNILSNVIRCAYIDNPKPKAEPKGC